MLAILWNIFGVHIRLIACTFFLSQDLFIFMTEDSHLRLFLVMFWSCIWAINWMDLSHDDQPTEESAP